jgi:hypothetical protein
MNYTESIHELLDGTLEQHKEDSLFLALASNEDLRTELKQFIQFDLAVKQDIEAYQPEPDSQSKIFGALGIPVAGVVGGAAAASNLGTNIFAAKYFQNIMLGLSSAVVGAMLMFFWINNEKISNNDNLGNKNSILSKNYTAPIINQTTKESSKIPVMSSVAVDTVYKVKTIIKYLPGTEKIVYVDSSAKDESEDFANNITQSNFINDNFSNSQVNSKLYLTKYSSNNFDDLTKYSPYNFSDFDNSFLRNLSLELKGNEDWTINTPFVERSTYPVFNNSSASLLYKISDDFQVGIDVRQEYFYQEYNGIADDKSKYNYYQHTNYISSGIMARYSLLNLTDTKVFIQPEISLNQVGPIFRTMIGSEYLIAEKVSILIGLEGSLLQFTHQGNNFYSPKIGLHYGIRINP